MKKIDIEWFSEILHGHLIVLVWYKKSQIFLRNDPEYYQQISILLYFSKFSAASLTHSLSNSLAHSFIYSLTHLLTAWCIQSRLTMATVLLLCESAGKKQTNKQKANNIKPIRVCSVLLQFTRIFLYGGHGLSVPLLSKVTLRFLHHEKLPILCNTAVMHTNVWWCFLIV